MVVFGLTALQAGSPAPKTDAVPMLRFTDEMFGLGLGLQDQAPAERALSMDEKNAVQREDVGLSWATLIATMPGAAGHPLVAAGEGAAGRDAADVRPVVTVGRVGALVGAAGAPIVALIPPRQEASVTKQAWRHDPAREGVVLVVDTGVDDRDLVGAAVVVPSKLLPRTPAVLSRSESMTPVLEASVGLDLAVEDDGDDVRVVQQHVEPVVGDRVDGRSASR